MACIDAIVQRIKGEIAEYRDCPTQPSRPHFLWLQGTTATFSKQDLALLRSALDGLKESEVGQVCFDSASETIHAARADAQSDSLTPAMADFMDNEVRVCSQDAEPNVLDFAIEQVRALEQHCAVG